MCCAKEEILLFCLLNTQNIVGSKPRVRLRGMMLKKTGLHVKTIYSSSQCCYPKVSLVVFYNIPNQIAGNGVCIIGLIAVMNKPSTIVTIQPPLIGPCPNPAFAVTS